MSRPWELMFAYLMAPKEGTNKSLPLGTVIFLCDLQFDLIKRNHITFFVSLNITISKLILWFLIELVKENYYITSEILFGTKISSGA